MSATLTHELESRIQGIDSLPTLPTILHSVLDILGRPISEIDVEEMAKLAEKDQVIAAQCLRVANSPLFARSRSATSVREATFALGVRRVRDILFGICVGKVLPKEKYVVDPVAFWKHSLGCGLVSRKFASMIEYPDPEEAYLAGLLHDLGLLANALTFPEDFRRALQEAVTKHAPLHLSEQAVLGFTHCTSGAILGRVWKLPADCIEVIQWHHNASDAPEESQTALLALTTLADLLCRTRGMGYGYLEALRVDFSAEPQWQALVRNYNHLNELDLALFTFEVDDAVSQIAALVDLIFPPSVQ
jgi:HD-like signal output (HDOD) protein